VFSSKFGREVRFRWKNGEFFLKLSFWHFFSACHNSSGNHDPRQSRGFTYKKIIKFHTGKGGIGVAISPLTAYSRKSDFS
jgi:hypothetical protein